MKKIIMFAALVALFVAGTVSAQVKVTGEGKRPGESPNRIVIDMGSKTPINTMSATRLSAALNELQAAILSLDEINAYREALQSQSCPLPNASMPTSVTLTLSEEDKTLTQDASGTATAYGVLCRKTNSCGRRDYEKVFQVNGTLTATLRGVSEDNLVRNLGALVTLAESVRTYRVALVQSIAACRKPADNPITTNPTPNPTPTPTPNQQIVSNNQPVEKEDKEKKKGCGWETFWGAVLGGGGGGFGASRVGNNNRTAAGLVGGGTGAFTGAMTARALCKSGANSFVSVLGGGGLGAGGGTLTGLFFRGGKVRIPPGGGNTTGPIRVCNGLPCNISTGGGNTGGNWNPIRINYGTGSTTSTPVTIRTTTPTTNTGGSWTPVRIN